MPNSEREFEVGKDEAWFANIKRTYDEFQEESLETIRRDRAYTSKVLQDNQSHSVNVNNVALQALQNAVETANMIGKQAVAHRDIAINAEWNLEPSEGAAQDAVLSNATAQNSIEAIVTAVVAQVLSQMEQGKKK